MSNPLSHSSKKTWLDNQEPGRKKGMAFHDVLEKKELAMNSDNLAKIDIIENNIVRLSAVAAGHKKKGKK
jgi:hypothetical protein